MCAFVCVCLCILVCDLFVCVCVCVCSTCLTAVRFLLSPTLHSPSMVCHMSFMAVIMY